MMGMVPVLPMVKYLGVKEGCAGMPLLVNERVSGPLPYGAAVLSDATAPQLPLETVWDAAALANVAAWAGVDVHTSRTAAAMAAAALPG